MTDNSTLEDRVRDVLATPTGLLGITHGRTIRNISEMLSGHYSTPRIRAALKALGALYQDDLWVLPRRGEKKPTNVELAIYALGNHRAWDSKSLSEWSETMTLTQAHHALMYLQRRGMIRLSNHEYGLTDEGRREFNRRNPRVEVEFLYSSNQKEES